MRIFDCHSSWATERASLVAHKKILHADPRFLTEKEMMNRLRANSVRVILNLAFTNCIPMDQVREYNDYTFDVERQNRDVIFGHWLNLDPRQPVESLAEYRRCLERSEGFIGFATAAHGNGINIPASDPLWDPFYALSMEARKPVILYTGLTRVGGGMRGGRGVQLDHLHPRHVDSVAARFPDLNILVARAWPWEDELIAVMLHKANVSYEVHGWSPQELSPALRREISSRLQDRVMFGCDFPAVQYEEVVRHWSHAGLSGQILEKIMHANAESYFGAVQSRPGLAPGIAK